ncbi:MAG: D-aminoacyl-tRNA deacylase [Solirubrobacterales bacterium]
MRAVVQRVERASVSVSGQPVASIGSGLFVLLGVERGDDATLARRLATKVSGLRLFPDDSGRLAEDRDGREILCVSQFTLLGDTSRGTRPGFGRAAPAGEAQPIYEEFCEECGARMGAFGEEMTIDLVLDGPVTVLVEV